MNEVEFQKLIWQKGSELYRDMPWRTNTEPYYVLVSEIMLQQTQVDRVIPKFNEFIKHFPTIVSLANAQLADVLTIWSGLGYNRRAQFLHQAAKKIINDFNGTVPSSEHDLISLPGIGSNTAGAILVYGYNSPAVFIETNIRTVYFHHFFKDTLTISDKDLLELMYKTLPVTKDYRSWYQALMDYGTYLKRQGSAQLQKSTHYRKQPPLKGSIRQVRGAILRALTKDTIDETTLRHVVDADERFEPALSGLIKDGLVTLTNGVFHLTK